MGIQIHLKKLLRERGMTGKELAAKLDITEANLSILSAENQRQSASPPLKNSVKS